MKKLIAFIIFDILGVVLSFSDIVVIKSPAYFKDPIRDTFELFPDSLVVPHGAESIQIPDVGMIGRFEDYGFTNLKKVSFGNIDYLPGGLFRDNNTIEEIEFNGLIGHFDCSLVSNCPNLRKIVFHGPVSSTGGPVLFLNEDANWNNRSKQEKEYYIDEYMAKNLYIMSANTLNQAEPEGETTHPKGKVVAIVPLESNYTNAHIITTDDHWFWQAPKSIK